MKTDKKGVSPVIATILLIALTVAAVGIVAVVLSGLGTPGVTPGTLLTLQGQYFPRYSTGPNQTCVKFSPSGPDVRQGDVKVVFKAKIAGRDNNPAYEIKGTIDGFGIGSAPTITWDAAPTTASGDVTVPYNPGHITAGATWEIVLQHAAGTLTDANTVVDIMEFTLVYKPTGGTLFSDMSMPTPTPLA